MKRPRFTLRTYATVMTLSCAYLVTWQLTQRYGTASFRFNRDVLAISSPAPFVVKLTIRKRDPTSVIRLAPNVAFTGTATTAITEYYLWTVVASVKIF